VLDGEEIKRCPRRPILDNPGYFTSVFTAYKAYIRGYLPDSGSMEDQGYRFTVAMAIVDNAVAEAQAETDRRERNKR
jgi:hypothetical protein